MRLYETTLSLKTMYLQNSCTMYPCSILFGSAATAAVRSMRLVLFRRRVSSSNACRNSRTRMLNFTLLSGDASRSREPGNSQSFESSRIRSHRHKRDTYEIQSIELPFVEKRNGLIDEFSSGREKTSNAHRLTIDAYRVLSLLRTALKPLLRADHPPTERMIFKLGLRLFKPYMRR